MSLKTDITDLFKVQKPDLDNETFGFRYFDEFLDNLDPFTQQYINQNIDVLKSIFMKYSTCQNIWNIEKFSENSYKQFGVIDLQTLQMILELYQPRESYEEKDPKLSKKANKLLDAIGKNLVDTVKAAGGDLTARSTNSEAQKKQ